MATNAERQAAFRQRRAQQGGFSRIDMVVDSATKVSLEELARCCGATQAAMLRKLITDALAVGDKPPEAVPEQAKEKSIAERYNEHRQDAQASLSETAKQKLERFMKAERKLLQESWHEQITAHKSQLREEYERSYPELIAETKKTSAWHTQEILKYQAMRNGIKPFMTEEEYKLVRGVCHPDREAEKERKEKAFHIMQRMESYFSVTK